MRIQRDVVFLQTPSHVWTDTQPPASDFMFFFNGIHNAAASGPWSVNEQYYGMLSGPAAPFICWQAAVKWGGSNSLLRSWFGVRDAPTQQLRVSVLFVQEPPVRLYTTTSSSFMFYLKCVLVSPAGKTPAGVTGMCLREVFKYICS